MSNLQTNRPIVASLLAALALVAMAFTPTVQAQEKNNPGKPGGPDKQGEATRHVNGQSAELGVLVAPTPGAGVFVLGVEPNGPAAKAGIGHGDFIMSLGGKKMSTPRELQDLIREMKAGDKARLAVWSDGQTKEIDVTLSTPRPALSDSEASHAAGRQNQGARAWLGVGLAQKNGTPGAMILNVFPKGPAARAGFQEGDVVTDLNGKKIQSPEELATRLGAMQPKDKVKFTIQRDGKNQQMAATLGDRQDFDLDQSARPRRLGFRAFGAEGSDSADSPDSGAQDNDPPLLQHHRRLAEQHERIETMLQDLSKQVQALRKELQQAKRQPPRRPGREQPKPPSTPRP